MRTYSLSTFAEMESLSEYELFELIQASSYPAFNELYKRSWKLLFSIAHRKTGSREDAFDLVQNVFMEFYDKREKLVINIPVKDYLRKSLLFKLSNYFRTQGFQEKHYRNFEIFMQDGGAATGNLSDLDLTDAEQDYQDMVDLIYQTIDEMPERMREIFITSRTGNYSIAEMAEKFNLSPQTVKNQISNAFVKIRRSVDSQGYTAVQISFVIWLMV